MRDFSIWIEDFWYGCVLLLWQVALWCEKWFQKWIGVDHSDTEVKAKVYTGNLFFTCHMSQQNMSLLQSVLDFEQDIDIVDPIADWRNSKPPGMFKYILHVKQCRNTRYPKHCWGILAMAPLSKVSKISMPNSLASHHQRLVSWMMFPDGWLMHGWIDVSTVWVQVWHRRLGPNMLSNVFCGLKTFWTLHRMTFAPHVTMVHVQKNKPFTRTCIESWYLRQSKFRHFRSSDGWKEANGIPFVKLVGTVR